MLAARPQGGQFVCIAGKYLEGGGLPSALGDSRQWASFAVGLGYQQVGKRRRRRTMGQPNNEAFGAIGRRSAGRQRCGETASRPASGRVWTVRPLVQPVPSWPPVAPDPGSRGSTRCSRQISSAALRRRGVARLGWRVPLTVGGSGRAAVVWLPGRAGAVGELRHPLRQRPCAVRCALGMNRQFLAAGIDYRFSL